MAEVVNRQTDYQLLGLGFAVDQALVLMPFRAHRLIAFHPVVLGCFAIGYFARLVPRYLTHWPPLDYFGSAQVGFLMSVLSCFEAYYQIDW